MVLNTETTPRVAWCRKGDKVFVTQPRVAERKTKNGKLYWIVEVIDSNNELTKIRCWGVKPEKDKIHLNRPYMARLKYDQNWGFSTYAIGKTFKLLG